jgi:ABC-type uncharacterized transport system substrate-binding protein
MKRLLEFFTYLILLLLIAGCSKQPDRKSILYINSYHEGYGSSDDIARGIYETLDGKDIDLEVIYMDTKRNLDPEYIEKISLQIVDSIKYKSPDLIIASDDNAVAYVVSAHLKDFTIPIVYCGVNWTTDQYDLPDNHITGMIEVLPFEQGIELTKSFHPDIQNVYVLSEYSNSEQKNIQYIAEICDDLGLSLHYKLVADFDAWKEGFLEGNKSSDLVYIPTNGAIANWDEQLAISFIKENIQKPVMSCDDFMMPYCVFGLTKVQSEQGVWAAETALSILEGKDPASIPQAKNKQTQIWFNPTLAEILNINPDKEFIDSSTVFQY